MNIIGNDGNVQLFLYSLNKYTKSSRYDTRNYDLVITADGKTEDEIVNIILMYIGQYKTDSFTYL
jgi:hypothetical protein